MTIIDRSLLTDLLLGVLEPDGEDPFDLREWAVGDHENPVDGGYQGEFGRSDFKPFMILVAGPSRTPTGDLRTPGSDVWFGYTVTSVHKSRRGVEKVAAVARERLATVSRQKTTDGRTIGSVQVERYGANEKLSVEPPLFLISDQFTLWTTK
jgi:hypothetical protein